MESESSVLRVFPQGHNLPSEHSPEPFQFSPVLHIQICSNRYHFWIPLCVYVLSYFTVLGNLLENKLRPNERDCFSSVKKNKRFYINK